MIGQAARSLKKMDICGHISDYYTNFMDDVERWFRNVIPNENNSNLYRQLVLEENLVKQ